MVALVGYAALELDTVSSGERRCPFDRAPQRDCEAGLKARELLSVVGNAAASARAYKMQPCHWTLPYLLTRAIFCAMLLVAKLLLQ